MGLMQASTQSVANGPVLAADVGGTHARVGLVQADPLTGLRLLSYRSYRCAEYPDLAAILEEFLRSVAGTPVVEGVVATAGHALEDGTVIAANLAWPLALSSLRKALGLNRLRLVNDFAAVAHAAAWTGSHQILHLCGPAVGASGPELVLGPGTGLGAALRIPMGKRNVVLATEAGQAALGAGNAREIQVLEVLLSGRSHVSLESVLSGPGLLNLYRALCGLESIHPVHLTPSEVSTTALAGADPVAREALEIFCGLLGSVSGDMALMYGANGGVCLAGGLLPHLSDFLVHSTFVERFLDKGPMRAALELIPVRLVEHGQLGVLGAADWYLAQADGERI